MFISFGFIVFYIILLFCYYIVPKKFQWMLLLAASFWFYYSAGHYYWIFLLFTALTVYFIAVRIEQHERKYICYCEIKKKEIEPKLFREEKKKYKKITEKRKKRLMLVCLMINFEVLAILKYSNFIIGSLNPLFQAASGKKMPDTDFLLPMGISFYTFQAAGYLLDVYWDKCNAQKNPFKCILFLSFFPQIVQGPISRYSDLSKTLYKEHKFQWKQVSFGLQRVLYGYFKKLVIADRMGVAVSMLASDPDYYTGGYVFLGMLFYAAQLYADFTGGIDITIGIAQSMGISLQENFIRPFFSKNIAEYWRRWHISMGTWFRDYVFYPFSIGGALKSVASFAKKHVSAKAAGRIAVCLSTMLTWFLTGIWHGAAWYFIVWGLLNGVIILISQELEPCYKKFHQRFPVLGFSKGYRAFQVIRTFLLMCCLRLFDIYGDVTTSFRQFLHMFTEFPQTHITKKELLELGLSLGEYLTVFLAVCVVFLVSLMQRKGSVREQLSQYPYIIRFGIYVCLLFAVILFGKYGIGFDTQQFIYNQF